MNFTFNIHEKPVVLSYYFARVTVIKNVHYKVQIINSNLDHQYVNITHIIPSQGMLGIFDWSKKTYLFFKDLNCKGQKSCC